MRVVMNRKIACWLDSLAGPLDALEVSGIDHGGRRWRSYRSLTYPEFDLCSERIREPPADIVIAEQVLEHVPDLDAAVRNLVSLTRPGGHVLVTVPFLVRVHPEPGDYRRFTLDGLTRTLKDGGLDIVLHGQWGNRWAVVGNLNTWVPHRYWHSLKNDPLFPVVVWAAGRKPL
jgi:SAM-dependent methyltransferase